MSSPELETFLARLYTDDDLRRRFLAAPIREAQTAGLSPEECLALERIDRAGLVLAARSFGRKREMRRRRLLPRWLAPLLRC